MDMSVREPFEQVYGRYFSDIYNFVYAQLLHKERSEDLVSDVFIKAYSLSFSLTACSKISFLNCLFCIS